jgi:type I restriction enzyme, S subunit
MSSDIETTELAELCEQVIDCPHSTPVWMDAGVIVLRSSNIKNGRLDLSNPSYTDEYHYQERSKRAEVQAGDLVITREAPMGEVCLIPDDLKCCLGQRMVMLRPDHERCDGKYLLYALQSNRVQNEIRAHEGTGSTVSNLRIPVLKSLPIPTPDLANQKAIAHILGTLDDKIELNRKTNETLEAMAKALFKSWFVDFDPVRAKAEGRPSGLPAEISDLFPDSLEDSELGEIPSGWGTTCLDELTSFVIGGDWGKDAWSETEQAKVLCLRGADIPSLQAFAMGKPPTRFLKESSCEKRTLVDGDIVLEISGGSTDQSTGRPVLISSELIKRAETTLTCSNFCRLIRFDDLRWSSNVYYLMLSLYQSGEMFQYETGTTGIKNFGYKYFAGGRFFPKPPSTLLDLFHCQVKSLRSSCHRRGEESDLLSKTRDALLPKLISGEIRIPDAEKMLEEVGV